MTERKNKRILIIGIDLSFNSTGITIAEFDNNFNSEIIEFHRLVYNEKTKYIKNINQQTYILPTNISVDDIIENTDDYNSLIQAESTIKSMICVSRLMKIIKSKVDEICNQYDIVDIYFNIEGFLMPQIQGENQFKSLSGLIMLQGILRSEIIKLKLSINNIGKLKIFITSPKELKKFFTNNGNADKYLMFESFYNNYDGIKLLPTKPSVRQVNDIIDSFALMMNCYGKINNFIQVKKKIIKPKKKKQKIKNDIIKSSKPQTIEDIIKLKHERKF